MDASNWTRALAFLHPAWMVLAIGMSVTTARLGLEIRRKRMRGEPPGRVLRERHLRFGQIAVVMVVVGFLGGPPSMIFVREQSSFQTFHAVIGIVSLGTHLWAGASGRSLAKGNQDARDVHRIAAASAIASAMLSAVAGFTLLP